MATKGYAAPETLQVFMRAQELAGPSSPPARAIGDPGRTVQRPLRSRGAGRGAGCGPPAPALAQHHRDAEARAHCFMGQTYSAQGAFDQQERTSSKTLAILAENPEDTRGLGVYGSQYVVSTAFLAGVYWALGDPEKAAASTAQLHRIRQQERAPCFDCTGADHAVADAHSRRPEGRSGRGRRGGAVLRPARTQQFRGLGAICARGDRRQARRPAKRHRGHAGGDRRPRNAWAPNCSGPCNWPPSLRRTPGSTSSIKPSRFSTLPLRRRSEPARGAQTLLSIACAAKY